MTLCDGGPPAIYGLGTPDQGAGQGPSWPLGQLVEINSNTRMYGTHENSSTLPFFTTLLNVNLVQHMLHAL
jgi:hypothetical protein